VPFNFLRRRKEPDAGSTRPPVAPAVVGQPALSDRISAAPITLPAAGRGRGGVDSAIAEPNEDDAADPMTAAGGVDDDPVAAAREATRRAAAPAAVPGVPTDTGAPASAGGAGAAGAVGAATPPSDPTKALGTLRFDGLTEEWRLIGTMHVDGRLSDALNRRQPIDISNVSWAPADGSEGFTQVPSINTIDPYDLIAVLAGPDTLPAFTEAQRVARRVRKESYDVALEAPPFRIVGVVHLRPGEAPDRLIEQGSELFLPLTDAIAYLNGQPVADPGVKVVLVNRLYIRGVETGG
jgi:hypothetical protein